jgi:glutathione peroxidase
MAGAYDFTFRTLRGEDYPLSALTGRPLVVVNTASKCGFTPQYKGLEALWRAQQEAGLVVIGVPSNDFAGQEPGGAAEIASFCELNYGVDFPMMEKVHVKGPDAHPFFKWAANQGGFLAGPKWNFFKYLVRKDGALDTWFSSVTAPDSDKFLKAVEKIMA